MRWSWNSLKAVQLLAQAGAFGQDAGHSEGLETDRFEQLGDVHVLGRQSAAQDVVRGRHDLYAEAVEVGVDVPGREVHRFAGLKGKVVQQQRNEHARVPGERLIDAQHGGQGFIVRLPGSPRAQDRLNVSHGCGDLVASLDQASERSPQRRRFVVLAKVLDYAGDDRRHVPGS